MTRTSRRRSSRASTQATELALAVPQVITHRLARILAAGSQPNSRDKAEFKRMSSEKVAAFSESWMAMGTQMVRANQQVALSLARFWWNPWLGRMPSIGRHSKQMQSAALGVLTKGMAPVHRRAVANARRLGRIKPR